MQKRLYFLDNLRTVLIFFVVMYHAAIVYQSGFEATWIVSDPVKSKSIGLLGLVIDSFVMFTIFFISGYFISSSIKYKTNWVFIKSKLKRIVLPWLLAVITFIPLYKIIFLYSRGFSQDVWYTYFHFFEREGSNLSVFANAPTQSWLWFLPVLFLFQCLYLILYRLNVFTIKISFKKAVVVTFALALLYSKTIAFLDLKGWTYSLLLDFQTERLLPYFLIFLLGALCNKCAVLKNYSRNKKLYIMANVVLSISLTVYIVVALNYFFNIVYPGRNYYFISKGIDSIAYYGSSLLTMLTILYILIDLFALKFNRTNRFMQILSKGSYNVYIVHMVVIGVIAIPLLNIDLNPLLKFVILTLTSFTISHLIIHIYYKTRNIMKIKTTIISILMIATLFGCKKNQSVDMDKSTSEQVISDSIIVAPKMGIHEAIIRGDINIAKQHIAAGSDINEKEPKGGSSPLATAITFNKEEIALLLINSEVDINSISNDGSTPLHVAAFFGRTEIVKALLSKNADTSVKNNAGATAYESVVAPFEIVKSIYDKISLDLMPFGFKLDYKELEKSRSVIADLLK